MAAVPSSMIAAQSSSALAAAPFATYAAASGLRAAGHAFMVRVQKIWRPMLLHAIVLSALFGVVTLAKVRAIIPPELPFLSVLVPVTFVQVGASFACIYLLLIPARALPLEGWAHVLAMCIGCVIAIFIGDLPIFNPTGYPWDLPLRWHFVESAAAQRLDYWWEFSSTAILIVAFYAVRDREAAIVKLWHDAELDRAVAQRSVIESRLSVIQARVEPEFLFAALADARRLYETSPAAADKLLDDLILYLRAALPQMRGQSSTLGREIDLCTAYLAVVPTARAGLLSVSTSIAPLASDVVFPPMVLLPLAQAAANSGCADIALDVTCTGATASVVLRATTARMPYGWSEEHLHVLRETLEHFYGDAARIDVGVRGPQWTTLIVVPKRLPGA